jgi:hypothetical protein
MKIVKIICIVCASWFILANILPCGGGQGLARLASLRSQANNLQGKVLQKSELYGEVSKLRFDFQTTRYVPTIHFTDPSNWEVVLMPENRHAYINSMPLFYRLLILDFRKTDYPNIIISSQKKSSEKPPK